MPNPEINKNYQTANLRGLTERDGNLFKTNELQVADELRRLGYKTPTLNSYSLTLPSVTITGKRPNPAEDIDKVMLGVLGLGTAVPTVVTAADAIAASTLGRAGYAALKGHTAPLTKWGLKTAGSTIGGYAGGRTVDAVSKAATGNTWAENVSNKTGLPTTLTELTNPGVWYGGGLGYSAGNTGYWVGKTAPKIVQGMVDHGATPNLKGLSTLRRYGSDIINRPQPTFEALQGGRYIYDKRTLLQNARRIKSQMEKGQNFTRSTYSDLGYKIPERNINLIRWKDVNGGGGAFYSPKTTEISVTPTIDRRSNIGRSNESTLYTGAHEATHAANDFLYEHPSTYLKETDYYGPNKYHPVVRKYYDDFMKVKDYHGKSPEETWANYLGYLSGGKEYGYNKFLDFNKNVEHVPEETTRGFVKDYWDYLGLNRFSNQPSFPGFK